MKTWSVLLSEMKLRGSQAYLRFKPSVDEPDPTHEHRFCFEFARPHLGRGLLLNIGCWAGNFESLLEGYEYVAVDIEPRATRVLKHYFPDADVVSASALALPFRERVFSVVTMWAIIEHLPAGTEVRAMSEARRLLKDRGRLLLSTMNRHPLTDFSDPGYYMTGHRHYRRNELVRILLASGLRLKRFTVRGGFLLQTYVIAFYIFKHVFGAKAPRPPAVDRALTWEYGREGFAIAYVDAEKSA